MQPRPGEKILELGTGCGIVSLILAYRHPDITIYGVEIQKEIADLAAFNVADNQMAGRIFILTQDMRTLSIASVAGPPDWVVSNPPYRKIKSGRISPDRQKAVAQHEIRVTLGEVVAVARRMLKMSGKFVTVYPAERLSDLIAEMRSAGIEAKRLRMIHPKRGANANRVLVEGVRGGQPGVTVDPPLVICRDDGTYTKEASAMFQP